MTHLDSVLKSRDITLLMKVHIIKAMVFPVVTYSCEKVKVIQLCTTLCDPMDYTIHGTFQARILEWVAFPFSRVSYQPRDQTQVSGIAGGFFTSWAARDCVDHNKPWKSLKEMEISDYLTWLLGNSYASQEETVRTGHGTTDWIQTGKGVCQGCIMSPCLFNLYRVHHEKCQAGWSTSWNQDC